MSSDDAETTGPQSRSELEPGNPQAADGLSVQSPRQVKSISEFQQACEDRSLVAEVIALDVYSQPADQREAAWDALAENMFKKGLVERPDKADAVIEHPGNAFRDRMMYLIGVSRVRPHFYNGNSTKS